MTIKGNTVNVNASPADVFAFLGDSNNIIHLLPKDKISDFKSTDEMCSFKVQAGVIISLVQDGTNDGDTLFMKSGEKSPFPFRLSIKIEESGDHSTGYIQFDGEVNAFLKMMVERPLTNLFNYMTDKLREQFSE
ncbi:MAG: hypothetical protein HRT57_03550 [Crocinitomicaceae bacterium]|nr:hypothetical protein [Crocinitomicaceae bacterium]